MLIQRQGIHKAFSVCLAIPDKVKIKFKFPWLILLAGIAFSLYLQSQIADEVFYSGDGGLKALLAKQFSSGQFRFDLNLPAPSWVQKLWESGLFPFEPHFVYKKFQHYYLTFPFTFPLVSAPFYAFWGYRGLYILPLACIWILWFRFYFVCQKINLGSYGTSIALSSLIFSSPLTIYSAIYWEHSLAVVLAFYGLSIVLITPKSLTKKQAILSGALIGLSVWFRPEFICFIGAVMTMVIVPKSKVISVNKIIFISSMLLSVSLFFALNTIIYGHPLGLHSVQVLEDFSIFNRIESYFKYLIRLSVLLLHYFPIFGIGIYFITILFIKRKFSFTGDMNFLLLLCTLFIVYVPLILGDHGGKQWGARYLLIIIPIFCLFVTKKLMALLKISHFKLRNIGLMTFLIFYVIGIYINTYLGAVTLSNDYTQRVLPALRFIQTNKITFVAVDNQKISQELEAAFDKKIFFLTKTNDELKKLSAALFEQRYQEFLYVCYPGQTFDKLQFTLDNQVFVIEKSKLGQFGSYNVFQTSIRRLI